MFALKVQIFMNINCAEKTIIDLLKFGCLFMIPRFQRDYSWVKNDSENFINKIIIWRIK